jgi:hypothetical protein
MLRDLLRRIDRGGVGWAQVKEKMGCLWVYIDQDRDDLDRMIMLAGERSLSRARFVEYRRPGTATAARRCGVVRDVLDLRNLRKAERRPQAYQ